MKISFILPCYNVERYIADCLDSIYAQDLPEEEYEVICVDDCSKDSTRAIIGDYASRHPNLTFIRHEKNLSVGGARNTGLKAAKGEYVWFVDPDDLIEHGCLMGLYEIAKADELEVLMFNYCVVDENRVEKPQNTKRNKIFVDSPLMSGQDFIVKYTPNRMSEHCMVWRCLFNNDFLKRNGLCFSMMCKAEDVSFLWKVLLYADRVKSIEDSLYIYRSNPYSVGKKMLVARIVFSDRILRASRIADMFDDKSICIVKPVKEDMLKSLRWCVDSTIDTLCGMTEVERANYYSEIVRHKEDVKKVVRYMNRKNRLVFSTVLGKSMWIKKVQLICDRECRKKRI